MIIYTPYTYCITFKPTGKRYYGLRTAKFCNVLYDTGCHPDDLWVTYFTSSKMINELISEYGLDSFEVEIRKTFPNDPEKAALWENKVLRRLKVKSNSNWFNKNINNKDFGVPGQKTKEHKLKISQSNKGKSKSEIHKERLSRANRGKKASEETRKKMSISGKGKRKTTEFKEMVAFNNWVRAKRHSFYHPDYGYFFGLASDLCEKFPEQKLNIKFIRQVGDLKILEHKGWSYCP